MAGATAASLLPGQCKLPKLDPVLYSQSNADTWTPCDPDGVRSKFAFWASSNAVKDENGGMRGGADGRARKMQKGKK